MKTKLPEEQKQKKKAYHAAYFAAHKEEQRPRKQAYYAAHREKHRLYMKAYCARPERQLLDRQRLLSKYGLPMAEYQALFIRQGGVCAICEQPETVRHQSGTVNSLRVDHDHNTGVVRGLLCNRCNAAIGLLGDEASVAQKAADYLATYAEVATMHKENSCGG